MTSNNINNLETKNTSFFPIALRYGIIGGVITIGLNLIFQLLVDTYWAGGMILLYYILDIAMVVMAIRTHRDKNMGGYIDMKSCISISMTTVMIICMISILWWIVLLKFIQPDIFGGQIGILSIIKSTFIFMFIFGVLVSLVTGAVMKKERPASGL